MQMSRRVRYLLSHLLSRIQAPPQRPGLTEGQKVSDHLFVDWLFAKTLTLRFAGTSLSRFQTSLPQYYGQNDDKDDEDDGNDDDNDDLKHDDDHDADTVDDNDEHVHDDDNEDDEDTTDVMMMIIKLLKIFALRMFISGKKVLHELKSIRKTTLERKERLQ
ncbi:hypothetical protein PoB_007243500 [Plakobranchus ocellatus]|uniref:Uncharacterized protein n=1 Tax=Plakobranchus ocellatus TaxID=259542 RepID=A0AAV4DPE2_9GAST|nr:hypothetical protein PoB_007243500 [Plakobranchus ocellatus]